MDKDIQPHTQTSERHRSDEQVSTSSVSFMVRRARLIRGETQGQVAFHMGVDQATVSRWERSKSGPTPSNVAEIRRIITAAEPCHSRAYIEASPTYKMVCRIDDFSNTVMISKGLVEWLGCTYEEMMASPNKLISKL